jgi:acyl transferase domain-containing protein/NAD(P)H-dependent flavin oxidoreductase YrpB (nitropropane dioxygenase family)
MNLLDRRDLVLGITPFSEPNAKLAVAVERAGGLGIIALGQDADANRTALEDAARWSRPGAHFGVRIPAGLTPGASACELPTAVDTVVLGVGSAWSAAEVAELAGLPGVAGVAGVAEVEVAGLAEVAGVTGVTGSAASRRVLAEVTSLAEAHAAIAAGAGGLIAKGSESGGRIGDTTAFVLLQQILADSAITVPVWSAGGIGLHSAAAAVAGGATGVVLDAQLALVRESAERLPSAVAAAIAAMDGSETTVIAGHRVFTRPDLPVAGFATGEDAGTAVEGFEGGEPGANGAARETPLSTLTAAAVAARLGARDLRNQFLPIGQDGAFARSLAEKYPTAGAVVTAIRGSIAEHIATARTVEPLAPGSALAAGRGLTVSVAQGPMTRVSDRAAFALAVAKAGGLPFLALALMGGAEVRALLEETAELLRGRPWGVGILGFVPAELRETQLAVVHDVRPPCALIAGGRPSQAAPLEAAGIDTFLHVPSPGLLDRFLRDGARKFVFEGRECGGHVGPRSSFALWESQVERLLAHGADLKDVHVLFAGGIHDERSAAMVAALAAPLAARGAGVGVLMGTAYLFTEEAVASGAIVAGFQDAAIGCDSTVLLETSPGHATRCVDTDYVQSFRETKQHLLAGGASQQEMWAELEQLNLGRLRLASKGVRRSSAGGAIVPVGEDIQRREGMVMIGEVATLRSSTTTVADLHAQVSTGATEFLARRAAALGLTPAATAASTATGTAHPLDIAIVGMAGVFAGAPDTDRYWANIVAGFDAITEVPADRWDTETYYDPAAVTVGAGGRTPSKWGGFLPDIAFDALAYGVPPASLTSIDPSQLLALEVAARALADAGYATRSFDREHTSVVFGAEAGTDLAGAYGFRALHQSYVGPIPAELDTFLPVLDEDSFPGVLSNVISGRIANRLDLGGSNYTVDAACASSLAALDVACKELQAGTSNMVLCGGADVHNGLQDYLLFASVHALSPTGHCKTFDAKADGIALGEGAACLVLKRLADAERDGDRVYAVIKAIAGSSDGRSLGLTAPRPEGQRRALERAYTMAGISPAQVGLLEAHGTGTVVGDRTELATLTELFTDSGAEPGSCSLGSVKSQIGHTKCAAGLAGIIKVTRALYSGVRPPTGQLTEPNGYWKRDTNPFFFDSTARPWTAPAAERFAGVSAFGFGGTNFHAVLGAYDGGPEPEQGLEKWGAELFIFRAADRAAAATQLDQLSHLLATNDSIGRPWHLRDLAWTVATTTGRGATQVAIVATDLDDLAAKLVAARSFTPAAGVFIGGADAADGTVAFLFPGQGSQAPGMLADLFVTFPRLRRHLDGLGELASTMFPPAAFTRDETDHQRAALTDTRAAQPALGVAGLAMHELLGTFGVRPDLAGGHSYGELVALAAAGAIDSDDLVAISRARAAAILGAAGADPGTMAAVTATAADVAAYLTDGVIVANHNGPKQVVISGPTAAVDAVVAALNAAGLAAKKIPVACAFHSSLVAGAADTLAAELAGFSVHAPAIPVWSNTTAAPYPTDTDAVRATLAGQVAAPVRFVEQVEAMYAAGARVFVEAGPGRVLSTLVGKILGSRPHTAVACDVAGEAGLPRFLLALAELAVAGVAVDAEPLWRGRQVRTVSVATAPRQPGWLLNGHLVRTAAGTPLAGGLQPMTAAPKQLEAPAGTAPGQRDVAVLEFLRTTRELVAAQRDVLLGYLGTGGAPEAVASAVPVRSQVVAAYTVTPAAPVANAPAARSGPMNRDQILAAVLAIVSTRTGYPSDMLDPNLDLEADLSIDSIKRTEILGELAEQVGLAGADGASIDESTVEELARLKTLNGIADWIVAHTGAAEPSPAADSAAVAAPVAAAASSPAPIGPPASPAPDLATPVPARHSATGAVPASAPSGPARSSASTSPAPAPPVPAWFSASTSPALAPPVPAWSPAPTSVTAPARSLLAPFAPGASRQLLELEPVADLAATPADPDLLAGRRYVIIDGGLGIGLELAELLEHRGADVVIGDPDSDLATLEGAHALVHLAAVDPDQTPVLPGAFSVLREAAERGVARLLVVTGAGGHFGIDSDADTPDAGLGLGGLVRTIRAEYPALVSQIVDVDPKERAGAIATAILAELTAAEPPVMIGYHQGVRTGRRVATVVLDGVQGTSAQEIAAAAAAMGLGPDSVVLLTGGARGITSKVAIELARATGCHIELMGRTQAPSGDEDRATASAADAPSIRRALIESGIRIPGQVEITTARLLATREIRASLSQLAATAASARYHVVDVRDGDAVRSVIADIYARHGRLDGVIHGAGVLEDKRMSDKGVESFERVFRTKVDGARNLVSALRPDLGFLVLFGSVAGVFGNKGQADYAAANDALDSLARTWAGRFAGRVVAIDWGPWAGAGMVSPELEREYVRRGVGLINVDDGVACLLRELAWGPKDLAQVVYLRAGG